MNVDTSNFKTLPISERIQLVEDIWDSIAEDTSAESFLSSQAVDELHHRYAAHQANPESSISWEQVRSKLFNERL